MNQPINHFVYLIECQNGHFYTGYTTDVPRRYQEHVKGTVKSKYTRSFPPKRLAAYWHINGDKGDALKIEHKIKKLSKKDKLALSHNPETLYRLIGTAQT